MLILPGPRALSPFRRDELARRTRKALAEECGELMTAFFGERRRC